MEIFTVIFFISLGVILGKFIHSNNKENQDHKRYIANIRKLQRRSNQD